MRSWSCIWSSHVRERSAAGTFSSPVKQPFGFRSPFAARRVPMKNHFPIPRIALSVSLIVLSIATLVNHQLPGKALSRDTQVADGVLLPVPTTPPPKATSVLIADGVPLPVPTTPPPKATSVLVADGVPLPVPTTPPPKATSV